MTEVKPTNADDAVARGFSCPVETVDQEQIQLAHGGGGRMMANLLNAVIHPKLLTHADSSTHDAAVLSPHGRIAFTTDSYIVKPLTFPGGDIGKLAVYGTCNDLAMRGAVPKWLSCSLIIEEGFSIAKLRTVIDSCASAAAECGVAFVTGDTKVVGRGQGDGLFINTSGIGEIPEHFDVHPGRIAPGDAIIISGDIGRHGAAIYTCREQLELVTTIESDCAPLHPLVQGLSHFGAQIHCLRDVTRGGLASCLAELAQQSGCDFAMEQTRIPVAEDVEALCEIYGLDPWHLACEGRMLAVVSPAIAGQVCDQLAAANVEMVRIIGAVHAGTAHAGKVTIRNAFGVSRPLVVPKGELLPRIC